MTDISAIGPKELGTDYKTNFSTCIISIMYSIVYYLSIIIEKPIIIYKLQLICRTQIIHIVYLRKYFGLLSMLYICCLLD